MSHAYHPHCGCQSCGDSELAQERRDEIIELMLADPEWIAKNTEEAEEWIAGTFDADHETKTTLALFDLARTRGPVDGTEVLERLMRLARMRESEMMASLRRIAEREA